jgi:hypothetical protein
MANKLMDVLCRERVDNLPITTRHPGGGSYLVRWDKGVAEICYALYCGPETGDSPVAVLLHPDRRK